MRWKTLFRTSIRHPYVNTDQEQDGLQEPEPLNVDLQEGINQIREALGGSPDIVISLLQAGSSDEVEAAILYLSGLVDTDYVNRFIMEPLMRYGQDGPPPMKRKLEDRAELYRRQLPVAEIRAVSDLDSLLEGILSGKTALFCLGGIGLLIDSKGGAERSVEEPTSQPVIRGPKEGFTENITTNVALLRQKIKDRRLRLENFLVGDVTKTDVSILFIQGIAMEEVVREVRGRIGSIRIDGILESGYIEEQIEDEHFTLFPTVYNTERPDVIAAGLLEGRVAILVDGTPFTLLVPAIFPQFMQASEDYYQRADISTLLRLLRYLALAIALLGPSMYIALTTFHQDMLPPQLLISLSAQREGIPFPAFVEALLMEISLELLREAGIRLPRAVGQAISIVGALVIGQAAVQAGIVSAAMVIVVAITAIANFVIPAYSLAIPVRILRFPMMGLAASFGLFGVIAGLIAIIQHLCRLRSFGVPYMSPYAPVIDEDLKDTGIRVSWRKMRSRPLSISRKNVTRKTVETVPQERPEGRE